ncbi:uncharacterized protein LOC132396980 [Hypanus sabinus]|uniref:uncharacterized protein LOC132396980 n=1 Tax=Hypanus sabinus TaxID=79690 RepID=UPI0028C3D73B|nr:uncharacterized protein LOC132396980 [Hypanus sabinus]
MLSETGTVAEGLTDEQCGSSSGWLAARPWREEPGLRTAGRALSLQGLREPQTAAARRRTGGSGDRKTGRLAPVLPAMAAPRVLLLLLLMTLTFSSAKAGLQCNNKQKEDIDVPSGSWVLLPCQFNWTGVVPEVKRATWQKDHVVVHDTNPQEQKKQDRMYADRTSMAANWFDKREPLLNLTGLTLNDTGTYQCRVNTNRPQFSSICNTIKLTVTDAASVVFGPSVLLFIGLALGSFFS